MTEAQNWMFYRLTVGSGTLFLGIAAILACVYLYRIAEATARIANILRYNPQLHRIAEATNRMAFIANSNPHSAPERRWVP